MEKMIRLILTSLKHFFYYLIGFLKSFNKLEVPTFSARISPGAKISTGVYSLGSCKIGRNVTIGKGTYINSGIINYADIGDYCSIAYDVKIGLSEHSLDAPSTSPIYMRNLHGDAKLADKDNVYARVGNHTWIGANAIILQGVEVGKNCVVAAGSVVTKNVPDFEVWGGVPAKKIKENKK